MFFIFPIFYVVHHTHWFCMLKYPYFSWINLTWLQCILLMHCWIWFANILLRIFASVCIYWSVVSSFTIKLSSFGLKVMSTIYNFLLFQTLQSPQCWLSSSFYSFWHVTLTWGSTFCDRALIRRGVSLFSLWEIIGSKVKTEQVLEVFMSMTQRQDTLGLLQGWASLVSGPGPSKIPGQSGSTSESSKDA